MDNIKEKLVELLGDFYGVDPMYFGVDAPAIAKHLADNGVTIQQWISVKERVPKGCNGEHLSENVIAYLNNGEIAEVCTGWCNGDQWWLIVGDRDTHTSWGMGAVTHWMPLPEPPKGE